MCYPDLRFVKKFTRPDFLAKTLTHWKCVYCNYFYSKINSVNAFISVILVVFLLEFECLFITVSVNYHQCDFAECVKISTLIIRQDEHFMNSLFKSCWTVPPTFHCIGFSLEPQDLPPFSKPISVISSNDGSTSFWIHINYTLPLLDDFSQHSLHWFPLVGPQDRCRGRLRAF